MYQNKANANHQGLIIFLLDVSGSMGKPMGSSTRIQTVRDALKVTLQQMVQLSLRNLQVRPRYRVSIVAYSDEVYDVLGGIKSVDEWAKIGIPKLEPLNRTDTTKGLLFVKNLLEHEIPNIGDVCPAPLIIHMTDGEFTSKDDPEPVVRQIQELCVADGNVLVESIFIDDTLKVSPANPTKWPGYKPKTDVGNPYGNRLLGMSSLLPELYHFGMTEMGYAIQPGTVLMYPGNNIEFLRMGFVTSVASNETKPGSQPWGGDKVD